MGWIGGELGLGCSLGPRDGRHREPVHTSGTEIDEALVSGTLEPDSSKKSYGCARIAKLSLTVVIRKCTPGSGS